MYTRTLFSLPSYADEAFYAVYAEGADDAQCEGFASRWRGLDFDAFERALVYGYEEDRLVAIFAFGAIATEQAKSTLLALLDTPLSRRERFACTLCLGRMHEEQVFPFIETLLLDGLSPQEYQEAYQQRNTDLQHELWWCGERRSHLILLLEKWSSPTLVQTLRKTMLGLWNIQKTLHPFPFEVESYDALAYVLGAHHAFGTLIGLDWPEAYQKAAILSMACGYLHIQETSERTLIDEVRRNPVVRGQIATVLTQYFGFDKEEQQDCIEHWYDNVVARIERATTMEEEEENSDEEPLFDELEEEDASVPTIDLPILCTYREHTASIHALSWSPDGTRLVSGSEDTTVRIWQVKTGETQLVFREHQQSVNAVAWSPLGDYIASGGNENILHIWEAATGKVRCSCAGHEAWIQQVAWSPDNRWVASASLDKTVRIWDASTGRLLMTLRGHQGIIMSLAWSPDGKYLASGSGYSEGLVFIWNLITGTRELIYREHSSDERRGRPIPANADDWTQEWLRGVSSVHHLAWSPTGTQIVSAGLRNVCRVWDSTKGSNIVATNRTSGPVSWSVDGSAILSCNDDRRSIDCWDATTGSMRIRYQTSNPRFMTTFSISRDGKYLAADADEEIRVWQLEK